MRAEALVAAKVKAPAPSRAAAAILLKAFILASALHFNAN
jgi:hypothetical protein